jgi:two-component system response regulator HydG
MAKILVVDDQRNMRTTLSLMLRSAGHVVEEADGGQTACERVRLDGFDLVLTDLRMGGKDGLEVLRHVKDTAPTTEVIVMTAYGTVQTAVDAMRLGAHDYLQKPFEEEELLLKVERAVSGGNSLPKCRRWRSNSASGMASTTSSVGRRRSENSSAGSSGSHRPTPRSW